VIFRLKTAEFNNKIETVHAVEREQVIIGVLSAREIKIKEREDWLGAVPVLW